jgi:hypothetical protein
MPIFSYYKIVSKDENIKEIYIGKTTNFKNRIRRHKSNCNNENGSHYNLKVYQYIRENGGWDNFDMIEIEKGEYDKKDSAIRERYYIEKLNANLNSEIPSRTLQEWKEVFQKIYNQEYYQKNIEKIKEKNKDNIEYYKLWNYNKYHNNIEKERQRVKDYYDKNREIINQKVKDYRDENRESILCECGGKYQLYSKARHLKTKKHQKIFIK